MVLAQEEVLQAILMLDSRQMHTLMGQNEGLLKSFSFSKLLESISKLSTLRILQFTLGSNNFIFI